jgi:probable rRNA maturation factor
VRQRTVYVQPWRVDVTVRDGVDLAGPATRIAGLCRAVARALDAAGAPTPASIGLILSDDRELAELNAAHMGADGPTDVLSFPLLRPDAFPPHEAGPSRPATDPAPRLVRRRPPAPGDIVVSVERAIEQVAAGRAARPATSAGRPRTSSGCS